MAMMKTAVELAVVVGVDGSGTALSALRWAAQGAHQLHPHDRNEL